MAKPQIETRELPTAIRWETLRMSYWHGQGYDTRGIQSQIDRHVTRLMECDSAADSQQFADVIEPWSAQSSDVMEAA